MRALPAPAPRRTPDRARRLRWPVAAALSLVLAAGVTTTAVADDEVPTEEDIAVAERNASDKARDVSAVQADLVVANEQLRQTAVTAAQAAEAYNGARWAADEARTAAGAATAAAEAAEADVERQQEDYSDALVRSYEIAPTLQGLAAVAGSDGIETMIDRTTTMQNAEDALDGRYDAFRAAATLADLASTQAEDALADAERLEARGRGGPCRGVGRRGAGRSRGRGDRGLQDGAHRRAGGPPGDQRPARGAAPVGAGAGRRRGRRPGRAGGRRAGRGRGGSRAGRAGGRRAGGRGRCRCCGAGRAGGCSGGCGQGGPGGHDQGPAAVDADALADEDPDPDARSRADEDADPHPDTHSHADADPDDPGSDDPGPDDSGPRSGPADDPADDPAAAREHGRGRGDRLRDRPDR